MTDASVIRLFSFRPTAEDAEVDAALRADVAALRRLPLGALFAGRRHDGVSERVVASLWPSLDAMTAALGLARPSDLAAMERAATVEGARLDVLAVVVALAFERSELPSLLRVFRGRARPAELQAYADEVREGTAADALAGRGPHALYLGADPPDRFVTVSAWSSWNDIQAATGGDVRTPIRTRHAHRLVEGTADHFELLPNAADETVGAPVGT